MIKRRSLLLIVVMIATIVSFLIPKIIEGSVSKVDTIYLKTIDYAESVSATGEIEQLNKSSIKSEFPAVVSEVLIKVGDTVKKGQVVAKVDKEITAQKLAQASEYAQMAGSAADAFASYQHIYDSIPTSIYSSVAGVVESVSITSGEYIEQNGEIASMVSNGALFVKANVPENKISKVQLGQKVEISGSGFENGKYYGYVKTISPSAKQAYVGSNKETVVEVMISIENCDNSIKSGYSAKVTIQTKDEVEKSIIPYQSVAQDDDGLEYVYIIEKGVTERKNIQTGMDLKEGVEILSGIDMNDIVVLDPLKVKDEGDLVKIID